MKKISLSKSEIKEINKNTPFYELPTKSRVERVFLKDKSILLLESKPVLIEYENKILPTLLLFLEKQVPIKKVIVDSGAVKYVASGADVMRPGIIYFDNDIVAGDCVVILEEKYNKALSIGLALFTTDQMRMMEKGKVIINVHYVGDEIWNYKEGK